MKLRKHKYSKYLSAFVLIIVILGLYITLEGYFTTQHENVHKRIFQLYNCTDIVQENHIFWGRTNAECVENENIRVLTAQTEIVGYHTKTIVMGIYLSALTLLLGYLFIKHK